MSNKTFAVGFGFVDRDKNGDIFFVNYFESFWETQDNFVFYYYFVDVCRSVFGYQSGNTTFLITKNSLKHLKFFFDKSYLEDSFGYSTDFDRYESYFPDIVNFLELIEKHDAEAYITILQDDKSPNDIFEAFLRNCLVSFGRLEPSYKILEEIYNKIYNK